MPEAKYRDKEWLKREYGYKRRSTREIGEVCGVNAKTVWNWVDEYNLNRYRRPWDCPQLMHYLYVERGYSIQGLCNELDGTPPTILDRLREHGIGTRRQGGESSKGYLYVTANGYERVGVGDDEIYVHQLTAIAAGHDPHKVFSDSYHVHHINGFKRDNRPENLDVLDGPGHLSYHNSGEKNNDSKLTEGEVSEIRQLYSKGVMVQTELADRYGVSQSQISDIVNHNSW